MLENNFTRPVYDDGFPPKPEARRNDPMLPRLILSLALFVLAYYFFFDKDISRMMVLVLVLFIHELGHFLAMKYFNYSEVKMFFIPFLGALVSGEKEKISQKQRAIILLAGPLPGIVIGAVLYLFGAKTGHHEMLVTSATFIFVNAANLLPVVPLDGGRLIETLFFHNKVLLARVFTIISGIAIAGIAFWYNMYSLLIIPFAMLSGGKLQSQKQEVKQRLAVRGIVYNKPYEELTNREYWLIREEIIDGIQGFRNVDPKNYQPSRREPQIIQQVKDLAEKQVIPDLSTAGIILFTLTWFIFLAVPAAGLAMAILSRN